VDRNSPFSSPPSGLDPFDLDRAAPRDWSPEEDEALRLWVALARAYLTVARAVGARISSYGLTAPQFAVLDTLYHVGPLSLGDLAEKLIVTGGNITYVVDRLERDGLVERRRSDDDRRVVQARLTPKGRERISALFPAHAAFVLELTAPLQREERGELRELLKQWGLAIASGGGSLQDESIAPAGLPSHDEPLPDDPDSEGVERRSLL